MNEVELSFRAPQRFKVLQFIRTEIAGGHQFPSYDAISHHLEWASNAAVIDVLNALVVGGFLHREFAPRPGKRKYVYRLKELEAV